MEIVSNHCPFFFRTNASENRQVNSLELKSVDHIYTHTHTHQVSKKSIDQRTKIASILIYTRWVNDEC